MAMIKRTVKDAIDTLVESDNSIVFTFTAKTTNCVHVYQKQGRRPNPMLNIKDVRLQQETDNTCLTVTFDRHLM